MTELNKNLICIDLISIHGEFCDATPEVYL